MRGEMFIVSKIRDRERKASKKQRDGGICTYASRSPRQQTLEQPRLGKGEESKES